MHQNNHQVYRYGCGIAAVYIGFASATGFTAGTEVQVATLPSSVKPLIGGLLSVTSCDATARVNSTGAVFVTTYNDLPANRYLFVGGLLLVS